MTDQTDSAAPQDTEPTPGPDRPADAPSTGDAWREVVTQIDRLGEATTLWVRSTINDPDNRRHAAEIREKFEAMTRKVGEAVDEATKTDVGKSVSDTAEKAGQAVADVGTKVAHEAAPHVASVLSGFADILGKTAERVGSAARTAATEPGATEPSVPEAPDVPDVPETPAPPAPPAEDGSES